MTADLTALSQSLRENVSQLKNINIVAGFDGFIDQMISLVEKRTSQQLFEPIKTISDFAEKVAAAAGKSSLSEIVIKSNDPGGCAVNLGDGMLGYGVQLDYFGTLGNPINPAFNDFVKRCNNCTPWPCEPGLTMALEFQDGKYMLSSVSQLAKFTPEMLDQCLEDGRFMEACRRAKLIAITDWTLYPNMTACWEKLQKDILSKLTHRPRFFIDLVDPRIRNRKDITEMFKVLEGFESCGPTTFGGNLNEANAAAEIFGIKTVDEENGEAVADLSSQIREKIGIDEVSTHCVKMAAVAGKGYSAHTPGPFCKKPIKSVGAGDRFNAGYCIGLILGLNPFQRLALGNATSGFFVRNARSGSILEIADFIDKWAN